ncbi:M56 family metallopeptidase [uncultured Polaribacter sp.]|uniref:M56 family metallopeptidase n=1 Tax=uncultured Polaribacter sp. TaxID=174711 RepID=UPI002631AA4D|nr:M56 family metallopeptidase [uncultured Polaribacter sp.]
MLIYLLKSVSCLALLLFFYQFTLEKEKMHSFNRFYLLGSVFFSFLAPLTTITVEAISEPNSVIQSFEQTLNIEKTNPIIIEDTFNYNQLFIGIYCLISFVFLIRFTRNIYKIVQKTLVNEKVKHKKAIIVLVDEKILPHTFWSFIFINKKEYKNGNIEDELFTHELTHVTEKHTLDVLIIELLQTFFWINPLFILLKKAIQLNHEFLADQTVINQHKNTFQYQHLLLNKAAWNNEYYLASNLNYSLTKKRLKMMTVQSSQTKIWLKKLAVIPLLTGFIFLFAEKVEAQENIETIYEQPQNQKKDSDLVINTTGFTDINGENHYYVKTKDEIKYFNYEGKLVDENGKILSNTKVNASDVVPNQYITKIYYHDELFCEFKNNIPKSYKNEFDLKEIVEEKKQAINTSITKYQKRNQLYEAKRNQKPHFLKSTKKRQKGLKEEYSLLGNLYSKLSSKDKKKTKKPIQPQYPYLKLMKNNKVFYKLKSDLTKKDELLIPPPPPNPNASKEEILRAKKAYEAWKKRSGNDFVPKPPRNHLDQVIKMAKKGAKFYFEKEPINSDKAIEILKKNKNLSIHSESTNNSNYKVWISKTPIKD